MKSFAALALAMILVITMASGSHASAADHEEIGSGRKLTVYTGCTGSSTSQTCTVDNGNGTSTVCTKITSAYYNHTTCNTYPNGSGKKLLSVVSLDKEEMGKANTEEEGHSARKLSAADNVPGISGCNQAGNVCSTDLGNGSSTTCINDANGYHYCYTHANGRGRKMLSIPL